MKYNESEVSVLTNVVASKSVVSETPPHDEWIECHQLPRWVQKIIAKGTQAELVSSVREHNIPRRRRFASAEAWGGRRQSDGAPFWWPMVGRTPVERSRLFGKGSFGLVGPNLTSRRNGIGQVGPSFALYRMTHKFPT